MSASRKPWGVRPEIASAILAGLCCGACAAPDSGAPIARDPDSGASAREASAASTADEGLGNTDGARSAAARSEHYSIVTPLEDPALVEETTLRLEAVRARLVIEFPPREPDGPTTSSSPCTVRICADRAAYVEAGGPAGSSCFYDASQREMVLYAEPDASGDAVLWPSLRHIAVHEYFADALGLELHTVPPWLLFGTAAVYAGMETSPGELRLAANDSKLEELTRYLAERPALPLGVLLSFTPAEFYGANEYHSGGRRNLVLAWSFAWFLRVGSARDSVEDAGWRESWSGLAPRLARALQAGAAGPAALDEALAGADLGALDGAWRTWLGKEVAR